MQDNLGEPALEHQTIVGCTAARNEKTLRETQTLRAGSSKAEPKNFAPPQTPFPGARNGPNLISWRWSIPSATNPVWWGSMRAILSYCGNRPTHRQDWLQYTVPQLAHSVMMQRSPIERWLLTLYSLHIRQTEHRTWCFTPFHRQI